MKKLFLLAIACAFFTQIASAQLFWGTWQVKNFGISNGVEMDMIKDLDYDFMISSARGIESSRFANLNMPDQDMYGGACENPHLRAFVTLGVPRLKGFDLALGALLIQNRYDGVYYYDNTGEGYDYLSVDSFGDEFAFEGTLQKNYKFLRIFRLTAGLGTNIGYSYNGTVSINGSGQQATDSNLNRSFEDVYWGNIERDQEYFSEEYEMKNGLHQRVFLQGGLHLVFFKRVDLGLDFRRGIGYRAMAGAGARKTNLTSVALTAKWNLRQ